MTDHESAQPCGCDKGANWMCEQHRTFDSPIRDCMRLQREENERHSAILQTIIVIPQTCFFCDYLLGPKDTYCCPKCGRKVHHTETP